MAMTTRWIIIQQQLITNHTIQLFIWLHYNTVQE